MNGPVLRMAWYRFRATFRRRWAGYLALALLIGLVGGIAMGSVVAARRTYASYPKFLASTNPSDLVVQPFTKPAYSPGFVRQLIALPHVLGAAVAVPFTAATLTPRGQPGTILLAHVQLEASLASPHGLYSGQDRVTIVRGRSANPARPDEVVASPDAAALLHLHVGSRLRVGLIDPAQNGIRGNQRVELTVVGIGVFNTQVLQDGIDSGRTGFLLGTPALAREFASCCASGMNVGLRLDGGSRYDTVVGKEYQHLVATSRYIQSGELYVYITSAIEAEAQRAIRPEAIALAVFGLIAGLAAVIIATQSLSRQIRAAADDSRVLRALGAGPGRDHGRRAAWHRGGDRTRVAARRGHRYRLVTPFAVRAGTAGRPGPRDLPRSGGTRSWRGGAGPRPRRRGRRDRLPAGTAPGGRPRAGPASGRPAAVRAVLTARLPAPGVEGVRLALEPGRGRTSVPTRSVIAGAVLAMTVVTATLTFGASLATLVSHPALYGWNFSDAFYAVQGWGSVPVKWAVPLLARDKAVAATTGVAFVTVQVDGQTVPAIVAPTRPAVAPHVLSGHGLDGSHQLVLGPATLAQLHQRVGGIVTLASGRLPCPAADRGHGHHAGDRRRAERPFLDEHRGALLHGGSAREVPPVRSVPCCPVRTPSWCGCGPALARRPASGRCRRSAGRSRGR